MYLIKFYAIVCTVRTPNPKYETAKYAAMCKLCLHIGNPLMNKSALLFPQHIFFPFDFGQVKSDGHVINAAISPYTAKYITL